MRLTATIAKNGPAAEPSEIYALAPRAANSQQQLRTHAYRFSETHTFSPTVLNVASFTFNQFQNLQASLAPSQNWSSQLGLESSYPDKTTDFPSIVFNGSPNGVQEAQIGSTYNGGAVAYNGIFDDSVSWSKGRHDMKFGGEIRAIGYNENGGQPGPYSMTFNQNTYMPYQNDSQFINNVGPFVGFAFANMELGAVASGSQGVPFSLYGRRKEYSLFAQDDYRVTNRMTINMGLRWDITGPLHELHGHWSNFSLTAHDPNFGGYNGAWTWLKNPGDSFETISDYHQFGPHLGVAYQTTRRSVVRASYGIMYSPLGNNAFNAVPYGSAVGYQGVDQVNGTPNVNNQVQPAFQWDAGYPGKVVGGSGPMPNQGYLQWGEFHVAPNTRQLGMIQDVYAGVQYKLSNDFTVNVSYSGAFGRNLHDARGITWNAPVWSQYQKLLMSGHANDQINNAGDAAAAGVNYPYAGWAQHAYDALLPYPQASVNYGGILDSGEPVGRSGYNAFTVEFTKRGANGLSMDMSFNHWRQTGNVCDAFEEDWAWGPCAPNGYLQDPDQYNNPHYWGTANFGDTVKGFISYQLPFGRGRLLFSNSSGLVNSLISGWNIGTIVSYGTGPLEGDVVSTNSYPGWWPGVWANVKPGANFKNTFKRWNPAWNPASGPDPASQFVDPSNFSNPQFGQLGNSPKYFQNWRGWSTPSENATIRKTFSFGEKGRYSASLRADFFDVFNRHYWSNPDMNMGSPYFGHVTGVSGNRTAQLGARFEF